MGCIVTGVVSHGPDTVRVPALSPFPCVGMGKRVEGNEQ
jgi:hypothetical protein